MMLCWWEQIGHEVRFFSQQLLAHGLDHTPCVVETAATAPAHRPGDSPHCMVVQSREALSLLLSGTAAHQRCVTALLLLWTGAGPWLGWDDGRQ